MNRRRGISATMRQLNMSLWLWPSVAAITAFAIGIGLSKLTFGNDSPAAILFKAGPSGARTVLTALVGGLVTALSVIFSLAITGLQVVHQQYSPRLLRNFMRDRGTKITLGVFAGSVAYMLAVIRALPASNSLDPLPHIAIVLAMVLFMACVGVVAYFAQHITNSIRVHETMQRIVAECRQSIDLAIRTASSSRAHAAPSPDELIATSQSHVVEAVRSGYVQEIDIDGLAKFAEKHGVVLRIAIVIGDQIMAGTPCAWISSRDGSERLPTTKVLQQGVDRYIEIGRDRSMDTDVAYSLRQLVDVAVRSMSPALNDPYTAVQALDHLSVLLCRLAREEFVDGTRRDRDGRLLVSAPVLDLTAYVKLACEQPMRYGGHEPAVALRLLKLLRDVAAAAPESARAGLREQIELVVDHAERNARSIDNLEPLRAEAETARDWSKGRMTVPEASYLRL